MMLPNKAKRMTAHYMHRMKYEEKKLGILYLYLLISLAKSKTHTEKKCKNNMISDSFSRVESRVKATIATKDKYV